MKENLKMVLVVIVALILFRILDKKLLSQWQMTASFEAENLDEN